MCINQIIKNPFIKNFEDWFIRYKNGDKSLDDNLSGMIEHGLSENEASFILSFTAIKSSWVNRELRDGVEKINEDKLLFADGLTNALLQMPTFSDSIAYRMDSPVENEDEDGIVREWFQRKIGSTFRIPYFLSTSKDNWKNTAYSWKISTLKEKSFARNISKLTNNRNENEVLFLRNSKFRIVNVDKDYFYLTEIDSNLKVDFDLVGLYYKNIK